MISKVKIGRKFNGQHSNNFRFLVLINSLLKQNHLNHLKGRDVGEISKPVKRKLTEVEITRPIPKMAESIIRQKMDIAPDFKYMFPRYYIVADKPIDQKTAYRPSLVLGEMMSGLGYTETRNHDMRRTARNAWEQLRFPPYVSETMLGHKVHKGVMAHYVDYDYLEEQRECYDIWCEYIQKKVSDFLSNQRHISQLGSAS